MMLLRRSQRGVSRRAFSAAILAAGLAPFAVHAAPPWHPPVLETSFLVIPNKPFLDGSALLKPSGIRAMVGKKAYEVRSVKPASESNSLRIKVVFDFSITSAEDRPCLLQQARAVWRDLQGVGDIEMLMISVTWSDTHWIIGSWKDRTYEYFLDEAVEEDACSQPLNKRRHWGDEPRYYHGSSIIAFSNLAHALRWERGPVAVIWIGQRFSWFMAYGDPVWLSGITRVGVSFFPVVWLNGRSVTSAHVRKSVRDAAKMAGFLGGQVYQCGADLRQGVRELIGQTRRCWIVRIAGEEVVPGRGRWLEISDSRDRARLDLKRRFVRIDEMREYGEPQAMRVPRVPLFEAEWLEGNPGCETEPRDKMASLRMRALIPEAMARPGSGSVAVVEYLSQVFSFAMEARPGKQEVWFDGYWRWKMFQWDSRPSPIAPAVGETHAAARLVPSWLEEAQPEVTWSSPAAAALGAVCIDLPPAQDRDGTYRVVVFQPRSGWAAVGFVPAAERYAYQRKNLLIQESSGYKASEP